MFFLGILGILQIFFIPGLIILRSINFKPRFIAYLMAVITTSLISNYSLVFFLTAIHLYTRISLFIIITSEISYFIWQYHNELNKPITYWLQRIRKTWSGAIIKWEKYLQFDRESSSINYFVKIAYIGFCIILAYISINWIWKLFLWNLGSVFNSYDTIAIWNRWALDWSNNILPDSTWRYPQLLPANWSTLFVLTGNTSIQFFAQAIMPLFTLFILIMIVDLGFCKKNPGFFLGAAITYLTLKKFLGPFVIEGLADIPSAFFAFSAIYLLLVFQIDDRSIVNKKDYGIFIAVSAAGCAITKQVGLVFLLLFSILFFLFYLKPLIKKNIKTAKKIIIITFTLVIIIVVPWYFYKQMMIWQGLEKSEVQMIIGATEHAFGASSIYTQLLEIGKLLGKYLYLLLFLIPLSFFVEPIIGYINGFLILPLIISWGLFASYDFRNLAIVLPMFSISSGLSIQYIVDYAFKLFKKISFSKMTGKIILVLLMITVILIGIFVFPDKLLEFKQSEQAMNSFSPSINQKLVTAVENDAGNYSIITNYPLPNLPGMGGKKVGFLFNDYNDYQLTLQYSKAENLYFLVPKNSDQKIMNDITEKINLGKYQLIFEDDSWIPYLFIKVLIK